MVREVLWLRYFFVVAGLTNSKAGYAVSAELQGVRVGASADANINTIIIYFEVVHPAKICT